MSIVYVTEIELRKTTKPDVEQRFDIYLFYNSILCHVYSSHQVLDLLSSCSWPIYTYIHQSQQKFKHCNPQQNLSETLKRYYGHL